MIQIMLYRRREGGLQLSLTVSYPGRDTIVPVRVVLPAQPDIGFSEALRAAIEYLATYVGQDSTSHRAEGSSEDLRH